MRLQYRRERIGRVAHPPPPSTLIHADRVRVSTLIDSMITDGWTEGRTDKWTKPLIDSQIVGDVQEKLKNTCNLWHRKKMLEMESSDSNFRIKNLICILRVWEFHSFKWQKRKLQKIWIEALNHYSALIKHRRQGKIFSCSKGICWVINVVK